ncbi:hypothetical protein [Oligoflexus tunisiensis]|uniref:hypothetical protein n=1 Tax=Oligoflexus tunisiensis TaxID=708132 RepID=UPI00114C9120|nr:hypothetical protein [Oligoflexus tunisiensis]
MPCLSQVNALPGRRWILLAFPVMLSLSHPAVADYKQECTDYLNDFKLCISYNYDNGHAAANAHNRGNRAVRSKLTLYDVGFDWQKKEEKLFSGQTWWGFSRYVGTPGTFCAQLDAARTLVICHPFLPEH